jgi:hypothetical protein
MLTCEGRNSARSDDQHELWWPTRGGPAANPSGSGSMVSKFQRPTWAPLICKGRTGTRSDDWGELWGLATGGPAANPSGDGSVVKLI